MESAMKGWRLTVDEWIWRGVGGWVNQLAGRNSCSLPLKTSRHMRKGTGWETRSEGGEREAATLHIFRL